MVTTVRYVGLDVHKASITIAVAEPDRAPAQLYTTVANDWPQLCKALKRLSPTLLGYSRQILPFPMVSESRRLRRQRTGGQGGKTWQYSPRSSHGHGAA